MRRITIRLITSLGFLTLYYLFYLQLLGIGIGFAVSQFSSKEANVCTSHVTIETLVPTINLGCYLGK